MKNNNQEAVGTKHLLRGAYSVTMRMLTVLREAVTIKIINNSEDEQ